MYVYHNTNAESKQYLIAEIVSITIQLIIASNTFNGKNTNETKLKEREKCSQPKPCSWLRILHSPLVSLRATTNSNTGFNLNRTNFQS